MVFFYFYIFYKLYILYFNSTIYKYITFLRLLLVLDENQIEYYVRWGAIITAPAIY